jgi:hypothetical protein
MYVLGAGAFAAGLLYLAYGDYLLGGVLVVAVGGSSLRLVLASRRPKPREPMGSRRAALARSTALAALGIACILVAVFAYMPALGLRVAGVLVGAMAIFLSIRTYEIERRGWR